MFPAFSKIWLINISLAALTVFFGMMSYDVWSKGDETIPELQTGKIIEKPLPVKGFMERAMPPESAFGVVVDKNIFSPNRTEFVPEQQKPGPIKISEKMVFLYGVVLTGDRKQALISNPETGPGPAAGKGRTKDKWIKVGDTLGNFSVTDIKKDRIILTEGANKHEILLYDKNKPARQTAATVVQKLQAPTVVATGSAAAEAAVKSDLKPDTKPDTKPGTEPGKEPSTARIAEGKSASEGEYKIIHTPFGPVKRRIQ